MLPPLIAVMVKIAWISIPILLIVVNVVMLVLRGKAAWEGVVVKLPPIVNLVKFSVPMSALTLPTMKITVALVVIAVGWIKRRENK